MTTSSETANAVTRQGRQRTAASAWQLDLDLDLEPPLGAHLVTPRHGYAHHGIYAGHGMVVHYAGYCHRHQRGPVEELSLAAFADGHGITVLPAPMARYDASALVQRARSRLGENRYRLLTNNCEHFCTWCLYGEGRSEQVRHYFVHPLNGLRLATGLLMRCLKTFALPAWRLVGI